MNCHICQREAIDRCYTCGELFCERHGRINCSRCETGIAAGDRRDDRVSQARHIRQAKPGWWRPQETEDYVPPACHACGGLAPYVCLKCDSRYCRDHAGRKGLCLSCQKSLGGGNLFLVLLVLILGGLTVLGLMHGPWK